MPHRGMRPTGLPSHFVSPAWIALIVARCSRSSRYVLRLAWNDAVFLVQTRVWGEPLRSVWWIRSILLLSIWAWRWRRSSFRTGNRWTFSRGSSRKRFSSEQSSQLHSIRAARRKSFGSWGSRAVRASSCRRTPSSQRISAGERLLDVLLEPGVEAVDRLDMSPSQRISLRRGQGVIDEVATSVRTARSRSASGPVRRALQPGSICANTSPYRSSRCEAVCRQGIRSPRSAPPRGPRPELFPAVFLPRPGRTDRFQQPDVPLHRVGRRLLHQRHELRPKRRASRTSGATRATDSPGSAELSFVIVRSEKIPDHPRGVECDEAFQQPARRCSLQPPRVRRRTVARATWR